MNYNCLSYMTACDMPPPLPNAVLDLNGDNFVGHQRYYNCLNGYAPTSPGPIMIECVAEIVADRGRAVWSPPTHACSGRMSLLLSSV